MTHEELELKVGRLADYVKEMARQHNELEKQVRLDEEAFNEHINHPSPSEPTPEFIDGVKTL